MYGQTEESSVSGSSMEYSKCWEFIKEMEGLRNSSDEAKKMEKVTRIVNRIRSLVKKDLKLNQLKAIASLAFHIGIENLIHETDILTIINNSEDLIKARPQIEEAFLEWVFYEGKSMVHQTRRLSEITLFYKE